MVTYSPGPAEQTADRQTQTVSSAESPPSLVSRVIIGGPLWFVHHPLLSSRVPVNMYRSMLYWSMLSCVPLCVIPVHLPLVPGQLPDVYQQGPLRPYTGYSDVALFRYHVPPATSSARWEFAAVHDDPSCQATEVHV